jgi:dTDP-4-dehydrorhamnose reductase
MPVMKVMLLGARGQLGSDLVRVLAPRCEVLPFTHAELDVCHFERTGRAVDEAKPDVVINTTAFHRVEECEDKPEEAFQVNALAVRNLARVCREHRARLLHISTDYVFGGGIRKPRSEADPPDPLNVYGASKLAGEYFVRQTCPRHWIVRTSGLYGVAGASGKGGNFVELMIRLAREGKPIQVVNDQVLTPTYTRDLAHQIEQLIRTEAYGLYHVSSSGQCSWYEFAARIFDLLGLKPELAPTTTSQFGAKVRRPDYSVLDHTALIRLTGADLRPWEQALEAYLEEKGHRRPAQARAA